MALSSKAAPGAPIGREGDLARLDAVRAIVREGAPRFLVVSGEAGIGKTRFVDAAGERARREGWRVLVGACLDVADGGLPYLPFAELLRGLARATRPEVLASLLGPARAEIALISPELEGDGGDGTPEGQPPGTSGSMSQARLFERVLQVVGRLAATMPTMLVIEDAQWLDRASRDLLTFLARNLASEAVLVVLTLRTEALPAGDPTLVWLAELGRGPGGDRIELGRLDRAATARLLEDVGGGAASADVVDRIWRRSGGNPFFAAELCAVSGQEGGRSATLDQILAGRIGLLGGSSRRIVDAAAIAGRAIDEEVLANVLGEAVSAVGLGLREAIERGVLVSQADGDLVFRHELLREAAEADLLAGERRRLHARFAEVLAAAGPGDAASPAVVAAEIAHHWLGAGRIREGYAASIAAARAAEDVFAHADAAGHYRRAIELESGLSPVDRPTAAETLDLRRRAADAADLAGEVEAALALIREAIASVDPVTDPTTAGLLHSRLGYLFWAAGAGDILAEHRAAADLVPPEPPSAARARVLARLASALFGAAAWVECRDAAEAAVDAAVAAGERTEESLGRNILGSVLVTLGSVDDGIEQLRRAREIAADVGVPDTLAIAHHNLAINLLQADRFEEAAGEARAGLEAARRTGLERRFGPDLVALLADTLLRLGRWQEADDLARSALELDPIGSGTTYLATVIGHLAAVRGNEAEARARLDPIDLAVLDADVASRVSHARAEARILAADPGGALESIRDGLAAVASLDDVMWTAPLVGLGLRAAADVADGPAMPSPLPAADLEARLPDLAARAATGTSAAWVLTGRAELTRYAGRPDPTAWAAAAAAWERVPDPFRAAEARYRQAEAELRLRGVKADVSALLDGAHGAAADLGAGPLAAAVERLARRARVSLSREPIGAGARTDAQESTPAGAPAGAPSGALAGLSSRELEVLELVAAGLSNGQIAERLFISRKTAAVHVTHILDKLGAANRFEAALVAERAGWRPAGPSGSSGSSGYSE